MGSLTIATLQHLLCCCGAACALRDDKSAFAASALTLQATAEGVSMNRFKPASALLLVLLLSTAAANAQTKIKPGFNLFSPEQDVQIGQESASQAEQQLPILNDAQVNNYVNGIGQRLARNAGGPAFQ